MMGIWFNLDLAGYPLWLVTEEIRCTEGLVFFETFAKMNAHFVQRQKVDTHNRF